MRLISETGEQLGVMKTEDAIARAMDVGQDLIEVAPNAKPPVAKILNYGKLKYEEKKKAQSPARTESVNRVSKTLMLTLPHKRVVSSRFASFLSSSTSTAA